MRGRRLSQISIVGHYAYENRPTTLLPWASNSCTSRHTRAMAQAARPAAQMVGARDRRRGHAPSLTPAPVAQPCRPRCCTAAPGRGREAGPRLGRQQPGRQGAQAARRWPRPGGWGGVLPAEQRQDWPRFREATVAWLRQQYGERLRSVVEHTDEAHPHLHFYAVPLPGERFQVLHPGRQAAAEKGPPRGKRAHRTPHTSRLWWGGRMAFKGP